MHTVRVSYLINQVTTATTSSQRKSQHVGGDFKSAGGVLRQYELRWSMRV